MTAPPVVGSPFRAELDEEAMVNNGRSTRGTQGRYGFDHKSNGNR